MGYHRARDWGRIVPTLHFLANRATVARMFDSVNGELW